MALSKPTFLTHLKNLLHHRHHRRTFQPPVFLRFLSFATPEEAAAERRRRKRRLRIEPPLSSLRNQQQQAPQQPRQPPQNPNAPKLPEPISSLSGNRLNLHNKILTLIRQNDLEEASLFTRHSIYSNCRPTIYTVNAVLTASIRQSRYSDFLALHRFIIQAGVAPNIITHNLLINVYCDCRKYDTALEHYKQLINDAPFNPSPTTYRILIKGLIDGNRLEKCLELKDEMLEKGFDADPIVYNYLMEGYLRNEDADGAFKVYEELKEKMGVDMVEEGVVYGSLVKGYFMKGMEKEAMECYLLAVGEDSKVKMSAMAFDYLLDSLCKNGKSGEALSLFDRIMEEHSPPKRLTVNIGSFNVMVEWYCSQGKFEDAMAVFRKMGVKRCSPDALSFNVLIEQLCNNGLLAEAEGLYGEMGDKCVNPDECTFVLLMDACFKADRANDAVGYYRKMLDSGLRPNLAVYNKVVDGLVMVGNIDEAKSIFDIMVKKLKMEAESYKFIMKALSDSGRLDEVLEIADGMLDEEVSPLDEEMQEFVKVELGKVGREEDLTKLMEEKVRQKEEAKAREAEAAEKAKASARAAVSALMPSKLFGTKEETESTENVVEASFVNEKEQADSEKSGSEEASPADEQSGSVNGTVPGEIVVPTE